MTKLFCMVFSVVSFLLFTFLYRYVTSSSDSVEVVSLCIF